MLAFSAGDLAYVALAVFLVLVGLGTAYVCLRLGGTLQRLSTFIKGAQDEVLPVDADRWKVDAVSAGLQKCLSGPPGSAPITFNERVVEIAKHRKHVEAGIRAPGVVEGNGPRIQSNYFDIAMLMDYWGESRLNHHTEATSMLYAAREAVRIALAEGLEERFARHRLASRALTAGLLAMELQLFFTRS